MIILAFCPFMSTNAQNAQLRSDCLESCAINIDGYCSIRLLAKASLETVGYKSPQQVHEDCVSNNCKLQQFDT